MISKLIKFAQGIVVRICSKCGHDMFPDGVGPCRNCGHKPE